MYAVLSSRVDLKCTVIFIDRAKDEMYIYIARPNYPDETEQADPFEKVPEAVLQAFTVQRLSCI